MPLNMGVLACTFTGEIVKRYLGVYRFNLQLHLIILTTGWRYTLPKIISLLIQ